MIRIEPLQRFSILEFPAPSDRFDPEKPPLDEVPDHTVYMCPVCSATNQFAVSNFMVAALNPVTYLSQEDDLRAMNLHGGRMEKGESYLEFRCWSCGMVVRAYYLFGVADRGLFSVSITDVIEMA